MQGIMGCARHQGGRSSQQDQALCLTTEDKRCQFLVVADGVGGHVGGELASRCVVDVAAQMFPAQLNHSLNPAEFLSRFCTQANQEIRARAASAGSEAYATVVALLVDETRAFWAHVGDSRLYGFKGGALIHQTRDHSLVQRLFEQGKISAEARATHPDRNQISQVLGMEATVSPTLGEMALSADCAFLLCTDGFWEHMTPSEMALILKAEDLAFAASLVVRQAARRGGAQGDNIGLALWRAPREVARRWSFFR
jgi:serine/threonine protein phosphatase PrpC